MQEYPHINTIWKRDMANKGAIMLGEYSTEEFEYLSDLTWIGTEKIDGTNIRVMFDGTNVRFGGRTDNAQIPTFLLAKLQELFSPELLSKQFNSAACLYGEGFGARIQSGGKYISDGVSFALFDVKIDDWWLKREALEEIASNLSIAIAPIVFEGSLLQACNFIQTSPWSLWGDFPMEGLVLQPKVALFNRKGERIITKIKVKDFM